MLPGAYTRFAVQQLACVPVCIASSMIGEQAVMAETAETTRRDFVRRFLALLNVLSKNTQCHE